MAWTEKEKPTPFDEHPIPGLYFVDGDLLARATGRDWTRGQKYPLIVFPSGLACDVWEPSDPEAVGIVHIFGELDLPLADTRDRAYEEAFDIAEQCGYMVRKIGEDRLEVWGNDLGEHVLLTYDNLARRLVNIHAAIEDNVDEEND